MNKFNFRLQKVLEYKAHIEKQRQQELIRIQVRLEQEKQRLSTLCDEQQAYQHNRLESTQQGATQNEILMIEKYLQHLKRKIQEQNQIIDQHRTHFTKKQTELRAIMQEKKSLEKYKEKKRAEYEKLILNQEQNFLDELALKNYQPVIQKANQ
jgi:flagellar FliJ protein